MCRGTEEAVERVWTTVPCGWKGCIENSIIYEVRRGARGDF